ncbi:MAG: DNA-3-methyladenine glycosylase [Puniceicoccales bacterium]|jgi:DNA-3-methyladenine glycosylase|nr:DNA-3-methyladenine glycosylase [Puniceicoccales bacterium]
MLELSLPVEFIRRSAIEVARDLIGCFLCRQNGDATIGKYVILETEAYLNDQDLASHARFGRTKRNAPMFRDAGCWYIYLCYGMYFMLNLVVDHENYASAVLIRGLDKFSGPGKLTKALNIDGAYNGTLCSRSCGLWIEKSPHPRRIQIQATPRVGIHYAGSTWSQKPFRFVGKFVA